MLSTRTADRVRVMAVDRVTGPNSSSRTAVARPRVGVLTPLTTLTTLTGDRPVRVDRPTAFTRPCLRRFDITAGIADVPAYRLAAEAPMCAVGDDRSFLSTEGPQGVLIQVAATRPVPRYLPGDRDVDAGQLRAVEPYVAAARSDLVTWTRTRWGRSSQEPTGDPPSDPAPS